MPSLIRPLLPLLGTACLVGAQAADTSNVADATKVPAPAKTTASAQPDQPKVDPELKKLKERLDKLNTQNQLFDAELTQSLRDVATGAKKLEAESKLRQQEQQRELAALTQTKQRLELEAAIKQQQQQAELQELKHANEKANLEISRLRNEVQKKQIESQKRQSEIQVRMIELQLKNMERQEQNAALQQQLNDLNSKLQVQEKKEALANIVVSDVAKPDEPFKDGVLTVSDRRIALNGPIMSGTADHITRRLHYYNNQGAAPIFLMIDNCPGGSVMEGYRILKAIEASKAPVHVVVKSFAASMAAVITTDAEHSYAYPNALILHHQPWSWNVGNLAEQAEYVEVFKEWARRLHKKTADKMGVTIEAFYKQMYKKRISGDWEEFADEAVKLKWVKNIVHLVKEEGITKKPTDEAPRPWWWGLFGQQGAAGAQHKMPVAPPATITLPRPAPYDFYFIYNRDKRFTWAE